MSLTCAVSEIGRLLLIYQNYNIFSYLFTGKPQLGWSLRILALYMISPT